MIQQTRVVAYDCRDHADGRYAQFTVRIVEDGVLVFQGSVYGDDPVRVAERIASGAGVKLELVGTAKRRAVSAETGGGSVGRPAAGEEKHGLLVDRATRDAGQLSLF